MNLSKSVRTRSLSVFFVLVVAVACKLPFGPESPELDESCASGTLRPVGNNAGYAGFRRDQADWYAKDEQGDYRYYRNNRGGVGNTLEYLGCSGGSYVWLNWEFNSFDAVAVRAPWAGSTDKGLRIGDSFEQFRSLYPSAHPSMRSLKHEKLEVWEKGPMRVIFKSGQVYIIQVDWATWGGLNPDVTESKKLWVGPSEWYIEGQD